MDFIHDHILFNFGSFIFHGRVLRERGLVNVCSLVSGVKVNTQMSLCESSIQCLITDRVSIFSSVPLNKEEGRLPSTMKSARAKNLKCLLILITGKMSYLFLIFHDLQHHGWQ